MRKTEIKKQTDTRLSTWLARRPIIFALTLMGAAFLAGALYAVVSGGRGAGVDSLSIWPVVMAGIGIWCAYRMIARMPRTPMDRRSFVAITNGAVLVYLALGAMQTIMLGVFVMPVLQMINTGVLSTSAAAGALVALLILAFASAWAIGAVISMLFAGYARARQMNVPQWKALLSMPFSMLLPAGYILADKDAKNPAVEIRPAWYAAMTGRITQNASAAWAAMAAIILLTAVFHGAAPAILIAIPFFVFAGWHICIGPRNTAKNIGGAFATTAVAVNIALVAATAVMIFMARPAAAPYDTAQFEFTETAFEIPMPHDGANE